MVVVPASPRHTVQQRIDALLPNADVLRPEGKGPFPTVIQLHGCGGKKPFQMGWAKVAQAAGWMLGFFAAIVLVGFMIAVPLFLFLYLKLQAREGWPMSIGLTLIVFAAFYGLFEALLHLPFPAGLLF